MAPDALIALALVEDIGSGDVTTNACVPADRKATGKFLAREPLVIAGLGVLTQIFDDVELHTTDGSHLNENDLIATIRGSARTLLERERLSLNFLQRLSGVATLAAKFAAEAAHTNCKVIDTRKTTPGFRTLEKAAAKAGGITNHRMGLYDAILIKNNHIAAAGGITQAIANARQSGLPIEIEVRTEAELEEALQNKADHLLLDNLTPNEARLWIAKIAGRAKVELSGRITLENVRAFAETGADFVSSGAITHSARAVDISFRLTLD